MAEEKVSRWRLHPLRVRYQETDQMAVVYHANYVNWFEIGRTEFIRGAGLAYRDIEAQGLLLPVTELHAAFGQPARYDELLVVCTRISAFSAVRMAFDSQIRRVGEAADETAVRWAEERELPGELLVKGGTRHVWVNPAFQPVRIDKAAPELFALLAGLVRSEGGG